MSKSPRGSDASFATTRWTVVLAAGIKEDGRVALASLCESYWFPLYAFARRHGLAPDDAQDAVQSFFVRLLEKNAIAAAEPARGRFRSFLLTSFQHFLANERARAHAQKRGGARPHLTLDFAGGEDRYVRDPADAWTAERLFDRQWALAVLETVLARLRREQEAAGKGAVFEELKAFLTSPGEEGHAAAADRLGMTSGAVKVAVHRLRRRYREVLREEVGGTVDKPRDVDDELRDLFAALAR